MAGKLTEGQRQAIALQRRMPYWVMVYTNLEYQRQKIYRIVKAPIEIRTITRNVKAGTSKLKVMFEREIDRDQAAEELYEEYGHIAVQDNPELYRPKKGKRNAGRERQEICRGIKATEEELLDRYL